MTDKNNLNNSSTTQIKPTNTLVQLIQQRKWDQVIQRCQTHPQDCQFRTNAPKNQHFKNQNFCYTPLHHCLENLNSNSNPTPTKVIETIAATWPEAVDCVGSRSICVQPASPVYLASYVGHCPLRAFEILVQRCAPPSVEFLHTETSFQYLSSSNDSNDSNIVKGHILPYLSRPLLHQDSVHRASVLHHVIENYMYAAPRSSPQDEGNEENGNCSVVFRMVQSLLEAEPHHLIRMVDCYGRTALHIACANFPQNDTTLQQNHEHNQLIMYLLEQYTSAANIQDRYYGYVPLQYLVCSVSTASSAVYSRSRRHRSCAFQKSLEMLYRCTDPSMRILRELTRSITLVDLARWNSSTSTSSSADCDCDDDELVSFLLALQEKEQQQENEAEDDVQDPDQEEDDFVVVECSFAFPANKTSGVSSLSLQSMCISSTSCTVSVSSSASCSASSSSSSNISCGGSSVATAFSVLKDQRERGTRLFGA